jgi:hypothetical protein
MAEVFMKTMLNVMIKEFNSYKELHNIPGPDVPKLKNNPATKMPCTIKGFLDGSYGKYPDNSNQVIMEYSSAFTEYMMPYLPDKLGENEEFKKYLLGQQPG